MSIYSINQANITVYDASISTWKAIFAALQRRLAVIISWNLPGGAAGRKNELQLSGERGAASTFTAEQKHSLLAEQIPEPPRRVQAQRLAPGVQRHRLFHLGSYLAA